MAQEFVGSNNINDTSYLWDNLEHEWVVVKTMLQKDISFTMLNPLTKYHLSMKQDLPVLNYLDDDGTRGSTRLLCANYSNGHWSMVVKELEQVLVMRDYVIIQCKLLNI